MNSEISPELSEVRRRDESRIQRGRDSLRRFVFALSFAAVAVYASALMARGWIPHDEGTLAQSAERVLLGDIPHRDFDEGYTGGLTYLHAFAFRWFGVSLLSMRLTLLVFFLFFVPAIWSIASRSFEPWTAALVTFAAVAWSVPNYFASLPSWYNLFFAAFGCLSLIRYVETNWKGWLFIAGLFAGASILFKIVGVYYVAAVLLFLLYREQILASSRAGFERTSALLVIKAIVGALLLALLAVLLRGRMTTINVLNFLAPSAAIVALLLAVEWRSRIGPAGQRVRSLVGLVVPFLVGVLIPCVVFVWYFEHTGSLSDLHRGIVRQSIRHIDVARMNLPPPETLLFALPYALALFFGSTRSFRRRLWLAGAAIALCIAFLLLAGTSIYQAIWFSVRPLPVAATLAGCALLASASTSISGEKRQELFLLLTATALVSLVQFPFSAPIYFCYVAPLAILATASLVSAQPHASRRLHLLVLVFYLAFAVVFVNRRRVFDLGLRATAYHADTRLALERGGLIVPADEARVYESLIDQIAARRRGRWIYAGPDCPEVYFLSGSFSPIRSFFDFQGDLYQRSDALLAVLDARDIHVVVVNTLPAFSGRFPPRLLDELRRRFPRETRISHFIVLWRG